MMPPRFSAVVAMTMVAVMNGEATVGDSNWWERCKGQMCTVAEKQAEGLARLRVLNNYIRETMSLMESVVSSLDDEMLVVGRELGSVVGRQCYARGHSALNALISHINRTGEHVNEEGIVEVISDDNDDLAVSSSDLTQGSTTTWSGDVDVLMGSSSAAHSTFQRPSSTSHSTYHGISQRPSSATYSTSQGISQDPSSTSHSTSHRPSSVSQVSSSSSSSVASHTTGKTLHRRPSSTLKKYEAQSPAASESPYVAPAQPEQDINRQGGGAGGGGHVHSSGRGHGPGRGKARGRGQDGSRGHGRGRGQGASGSLGSDSFQLCRGVPIGSPHYVPGLDGWCANNCPGNCPATHCICYTS